MTLSPDPQMTGDFCEWGCAIRSCVDCSSSDGSVITFDPNTLAAGAAMSSVFARTHASIDAWFQNWIAGVKIWDLMFEPHESRATQLVNPFTRKSAPLVPKKLRRHDETVTLYRRQAAAAGGWLASDGGDLSHDLSESLPGPHGHHYGWGFRDRSCHRSAARGGLRTWRSPVKRRLADRLAKLCACRQALTLGNSRRQTPGVIPTTLRKVRVKWA
jgi:hypothetical protein